MASKSAMFEAPNLSRGILTNVSHISSGGFSKANLSTVTKLGTSNRFRAVSVGAGISDWSTFYYSYTFGAELAMEYFGASPSVEPDIYRRVSPMRYIKQYRTPTLIQHGESDRLVPVTEAYRFREELNEQGVKVEMIVYNGFGHGINKPRSLRSATEQNFYWFNHFLWGDPLPDFSKPLPVQVRPQKL